MCVCGWRRRWGDGDREHACESRRDPERVPSGCVGGCRTQGVETRRAPLEEATPSCTNSGRGVGCCPGAPCLPGEGSGVGCRWGLRDAAGSAGDAGRPRWPRPARGVSGVTCQSSWARGQRNAKPAGSPGPSGKGRTTPRMERHSQALSDCAGLDLNSFLAWQTLLER